MGLRYRDLTLTSPLREETTEDPIATEEDSGHQGNIQALCNII
jgi:hypothetical protein